MSQERDDDLPDEDLDDARDFEGWDEEPRSSILASTWMRVLLVVIGVGAAAAVSLPYVFPPQAPTTPHVTERTSPPPAGTVSGGPAPSTEQTAERPPAIPSPAPAAVRAIAETRPPTKAPASAVVSAPRPRPTVAASGAPSGIARASSKAPAPAAMPTRETAASAARDAGPVPKTSEPNDGPAGTIGGERGDHWVQVGAFRDAATAKRLAARLREQNFRVEESAPTTTVPVAPADAAARYELFVSGASADAVAKLAAKGLAGDRVADGLVVKPSLPLREAVALSKELTTDGVQVQVRRTAAPVTAAPAEEPGLHRVRVGAFADRATALAALRALEQRGYQAFIMRAPRSSATGS